MLDKFATWDGSKPEVLKTDEDFIFVWTPFPRPEPRQPCIKMRPDDQYVVIETQPKIKAKRLQGLDKPTFFECNLCSNGCEEKKECDQSIIIFLNYTFSLNKINFSY